LNPPQPSGLSSSLHDIRRAFGLLDRPLALRFAWLGCVALLASALEVIGVTLALVLIQLIVNPQGLESMPLAKRLLGHPVLGTQSNAFIVAALLMAAFFLLKNLFLAYATFAQNRFSFATSVRISCDLMARYAQAPYERILMRNSADLIVGVNQASWMIAARIYGSTAIIITESLIVLALFGMLAYNEPLITLAASLFLGAIMAGYNVLTRGLFARWGERQLFAERKAVKAVQECLGNLKVVQVANRSRFFLRQFKFFREELAVIGSRVATMNAMPRLLTETAMIWAIALVIVIALSQDRPAVSIVSTLGLFAFAGFRIMPSLNRLSVAISALKHGRSALDRILGDIEYLPLPKHGVDEAAGENPTFEHELTASNLRYAYPSAARPAIDGVGFAIRRGQFVGIVGGSGAGKTTLVDVLLGLLEVEAGGFTVDGRKLDPTAPGWRRLIGYVPQEITLTDDTMRRNIAFGLDDAEIDDARVQYCLGLASLQRVVDQLPAGLETEIGERGLRLSGGQKQRIGIARALYRDPPIIVMDEPTSALDTETEKEIMDSIFSLAEGRAVIVIAHRLSTVRRCDQILFLDGGRLADNGTFDEIRARNAEFARMVALAEISGGDDSLVDEADADD
jgi:ABC-type multidrug transport system fused ATPase/permease subunit